MHRLVIALTFLWFFTVTSVDAQRHSGSHSSAASKSHSSKSKSTKSKSVHVRGYTRKDGTYVAPYDRSAPDTGSSTGDVTNPSHSG